MRRKYSLKERQTLILQMLNENGRVSVSELMERFSISEVSIRKDLASLEEKKLLLRVKGGAVNLQQYNDSDEFSLADKRLKHAEEKKRIGKLAASLIHDNDTIIIDSGTTTMEVAKNLGDHKHLTIITNSLSIALYLSQLDKYTVIALGGQIRTTSESTVGLIAESSLNNYYCDILFLGVDSINLDKGMSTPNIEEASLNQKMIKSAKKIVAVFDSSKFEKRSFAFIANIDELDSIVTDEGITKEEKDYLESRGIEVLIAKTEEQEE